MTEATHIQKGLHAASLHVKAHVKTLAGVECCLYYRKYGYAQHRGAQVDS